jgi:hypothetical protein
MLTFVEEVIEEQRLQLRVLVVSSGDVAKENTLKTGDQCIERGHVR